MGIAYADGTVGVQSFSELYQGDHGQLNYTVHDPVTQAAINNLSSFQDIIFYLSNLDESIQKSLVGGGVTLINESRFSVDLTPVETALLLGTYSIKVRLVDASGKPKMAAVGTGEILKGF